MLAAPVWTAADLDPRSVSCFDEIRTRAQMLLHTWKKVHVPFSLIMAGIATVHIWLAFQYSL